MRFLVVDDSKDIRNLLAALLLVKKPDCQVDTADGVERAKELFSIETYDAVITDLHMLYDNDGEVLAEHVKSLSDIPVHCLTACPDSVRNRKLFNSVVDKTEINNLDLFIEIFSRASPACGRIDLPASTASVFHSIGGDVGGNSQTTTIEVKSDGGQFPLTHVEKTETGFKIEIHGTWEAGEFMNAIARFSEEHGVWLD